MGNIFVGNMRLRLQIMLVADSGNVEGNKKIQFII